MAETSSFIGKIVKSNSGIKGKCIGVLQHTNELIIQTGRGGQIMYEKTENCKPQKSVRGLRVLF